MSAEPRAPEQLSHADREARLRIEILKFVLAASLQLGLEHEAPFVAAGQAYLNHIKKPGDAKNLGGALEQVNRWRTGVDKGGYGIFPIQVRNIDIGLEFKLTRDINLGVFFLGARVHRNMIRKWTADRMLRLMLDNDELARRALPEILTAEAALHAAVRKSKSVFKTTCERLDADVETVRLTIAKARGSR